MALLGAVNGGCNGGLNGALRACRNATLGWFMTDTSNNIKHMSSSKRVEGLPTHHDPDQEGRYQE